MAFQDSGGAKHTNHSSYKSAEAKLQSEGPSATPQADGDSMEQGSDGASMAQQHGPAVQISIDHANGHSVHAMHQDGHEHESRHGSAGEAHKYAADCAGAM